MIPSVLRLGIVPVALLLAQTSSNSARFSVWAVHDGVKVKRDDLAHPERQQNAVWDGRTIRLLAARNEVVAFQVVVEAGASAIDDLRASLPSLQRDGGGEIKYEPPAADPHFARRRLVERPQQVQQRALAAAGGSHEEGKRAGGYPAREAPQRGDVGRPAAIDFCDVGDFDHRSIIATRTLEASGSLLPPSDCFHRRQPRGHPCRIDTPQHSQERAERQAGRHPVVLAIDASGHARGGVPEGDTTPIDREGQPAVPGVETHRTVALGLALQDVRLPARLHVVEAHRAVQRRRRQRPAVRAERDALHASGVCGEEVEALPA